MYCGLKSTCPHPGGENLTKKMLGLASVKAGYKVLDFGCGKGDTLKLIRETGATAFGIDKDKSLCDEETVFSIKEDGTFPFDDHTFDVVMAECSLSCTSNPRAVLREMRRVLKKSEILVLSDMVAGVQGGSVLSFDEYNDMFIEEGFDILSSEDASKPLTELFIHLMFEGGNEAAENALGISQEERKSMKLGYRIWVLADSVQAEIDEISKASPFMNADDLISHGLDYLRINPKEVERIITINTSGTKGPSKRIYFSEYDLNKTQELFSYGIERVVPEGESCCVFMNGTHRSTVGGFLENGLTPYGCKTIQSGFITDLEEARKTAEGAYALIGHPGQLATLANYAPDLCPKAVLLSGDYIAESIIKRLIDNWHCEIFVHWGMTETCYGGAVDCKEHNGMHIRADMGVYIIDPETGERLPDGEVGELVFSMPFREAMPFVNYRTGDLARITRERCSCGSNLPRIMDVYGRIDDVVVLDSGNPLSIHILDELLFDIPGMTDFSAEYEKDSHILRILTDADEESKRAAEKKLSEKFEELEIHIESFVNTLDKNKRKLKIS